MRNIFPSHHIVAFNHRLPFTEITTGHLPDSASVSDFKFSQAVVDIMFDAIGAGPVVFCVRHFFDCSASRPQDAKQGKR
jgi:hypothetical protein